MDGRRNIGPLAVPPTCMGARGESVRVRVAVCHVIAYDKNSTPMGALLPSP